MSGQPRHVVMFSTGVGSYLAATRVVEEHGAEGVTLLFTDTRGTNGGPHDGEDEDNYRFLTDCAADLAGCEIAHLRGEESPWDVFRRRRRIGSSQVASCSVELKQKPARDWLAANCPDEEATAIHIGIDWTEDHRIPAIEMAYAPRPVYFPMTEPPYLDKAAMRRATQARGIEPPRLYELGFAHANCGGFCVRAGQAQYALLLRTMPERYAYHEAREQELRAYLDADVAILRDRNGGPARPLTLRALRERIEAVEAGRGGGDLFAAFDADEWGGCGCFTAEPAGTTS